MRATVITDEAERRRLRVAVVAELRGDDRDPL
jgi:hypothetical protein